MKNAKKCSVYLWSEKIGELIQFGSKISFRYEEGCKYDFSPISLPRATNLHLFKSTAHNGLEGVFIDSLPDSAGMEILDKYFEDNHPGFEPNTIDKLLFIGDVSLGALEYRPAYAEGASKKSIGVELKELKEYRKELLKTKDYKSIKVLIGLYKSFSPLAGARTKLLINYNPKKEIFSIGVTKKEEIAIILKLDESRSPIKKIDTTIEWIYSQVAREAKLNMPETYLFTDSEGFTHFGVERFDIDENKERLHTISLSGLLNADKSKRIDLKEFLELAKSILFLPKEDMEEIFRRVVFNHVFGNDDDHLKNHEFTMSKDGKWRLSPLFDVTYNKAKYMRITVNGKNSDIIILEDFALVASEYKIDSYMQIIENVQNAKALLCLLVDEKINDKYYDVDRENILNTKIIF